MAVKLTSEKVMVKDNTDRVKSAESTIVQQAQQIALRVTEESFNALAGRVTTAESSIVQNADNIALRVEKTEYNGVTIASLINQTAEEIKILAEKISLEGLITANGFFKVLGDGSIEAVNAKLSGAITATRMVAPSNSAYYGEVGVTDGYIGLGLFDLTKSPEAYFEVLEAGNGFFMRDRNNMNRIEATDTVTRLRSPNGNIRLTITDTYVNIIKNGNVIGNWG
ncbi:hypothetical protein J3A84_04910 [Proteiniclasticum sp. SCR006]|uniref:Uncharacterized protein n=1 Tax=Proteiniclasticum aestuarii TaxID=2817862 RepID=A0A939H757_9CLOT|nr:hypothetical protein [Proteiniclasticum aestuarii]MBO1264381.1 hypothetical protein [Proteiniclasticum aestuarii]